MLPLFPQEAFDFRLYFSLEVYMFIILYTKGAAMRTNIVIDDKLMSDAMLLSRLKTKKAVVEKGLKLLIQLKRQERLKGLRGKLKWEGDLDFMRLDP